MNVGKTFRNNFWDKAIGMISKRGEVRGWELVVFSLGFYVC